METTKFMLLLIIQFSGMICSQLIRLFVIKLNILCCFGYNERRPHGCCQIWVYNFINLKI